MQEEEITIMRKKAVLALGYAFPKTIPVMVGYLFLGMASVSAKSSPLVLNVITLPTRLPKTLPRTQ